MGIRNRIRSNKGKVEPVRIEIEVSEREVRALTQIRGNAWGPYMEVALSVIDRVIDAYPFPYEVGDVCLAFNRNYKVKVLAIYDLSAVVIGLDGSAPFIVGLDALRLAPPTPQD